MLREIPPAGQFVYRNILRRLHGRKHLWTDGTDTAEPSRTTSRPLARAG